MFRLAIQARGFSSTTAVGSKIGRAPITLPPSVTVTKIAAPPSVGRKQNQATIHIKGPLGELTLPYPQFLTVDIDETARKLTVTPDDADVREQREMWGSTRARLQNHVTGVSEGHVAILRLVGVGYRASIEDGGKIVNLKVQYAHPVELPVPQGVKASTPQPTRILLEGPDKEVVKQFAADIRKWREPEPYKGKGIFVNNETIKLKQRKIK
ncbi:mitochondrial 54S ribosomal protein YmL16 [Pyronema domesticum]|uniref:Large ribosomal subunit protein uL6m n=1 Tax=Pyronema omphalodes (strain CBS 100304) TaxID=1076935 RepID=U4KVZ4_PYROM|nr:mitochondrial 54S ribosomal protein YmL16 [Pyronema domesticum]CCX05191.1 Similar to 54S ribosomal protein L6, mitochondrial; acc. no. P32904 [Pyronema omphalodes CBS 100304]